MQAGRLPARRPAGLRLQALGPSTAAILSHPNVRLSVSHGSVHAAHEALATGTPVVAIPMLADQRDMAVRVADAGAGVWLEKSHLTAGAVRAAIQRVLATPAFAAAARVVQKATLETGGVARAAQIIKKAAQPRPAVPVAP